jgi:outer membrane protein assembly factor BamB
MSRRFTVISIPLATAFVLLATGLGMAQNQPAQQANAPQGGAAIPQEQAGKISDPAPFSTKDGKKKGWKVVIPGNRPLATPAVVGGKVFVGGGFGSHEFYALDAASGKLVWRYQTKDDGPTAAVVQDGYVAFNTESCEIEILALDGKPVWKKWLGDPLMSMPAISSGKLYMAYPDSKGDRRHYLACFELKTGKQFWKKPIAGEIITAPVVVDEKVYLATLEGTLYCFGQHDGDLIWQEKKNATSSPVVWNHQCYFSRREETTVTKDGKSQKQQNEQLAVRGTAAKGQVKDLKETARPADYLDYAKRASSPVESENQKQDSQVGFAAKAPIGGFGGGGLGLGGLGGGGLGGGGLGGSGKGDAKIMQAMDNIGQGSVHGVWAYQGSKPFIYQGRIYSAMGDTLNCVDAKTDKIRWKKTLRPLNDKDPVKQVVNSLLTPPVLVNNKVFLATTFGEVFCLTAESGEVLWSAEIGEPVVFQPVVAKGRIYLSTNSGHLYCLETGDSKDDGWLMWGASASHNGMVK